MHDRNGVQLKLGDTVHVVGIVKELYPGHDACNITLQLMSVNGRQETWTGNSRQVILQDRVVTVR